MISQRRQHCPRNHPIRIVYMKRNIDGYVWRCSARGCQATRSIRTNTFFHESKLKLLQIMSIIINFVSETVQGKGYTNFTRDVVLVMVSTIDVFKMSQMCIKLMMMNLILITIIKMLI
jgi:hypothetical protein